MYRMAEQSNRMSRMEELVLQRASPLVQQDTDDRSRAPGSAA